MYDDKAHQAAEAEPEGSEVYCNMTFGHNEPVCVLPYGALAEVDFESWTFAILEPGVA